MKNALLVIFFILTAQHSVRAQNIVPNYSFEQADSCPTDFNNRFYKYSLGCVGWGQANVNTTDYFNTCDTAALSIGRSVPIVGVPHNVWGTQTAYEGNAYTGICMYYSSIISYKEYLIRDIPVLQKDTAYKVTIHVSLADSSRYATNSMGVLFTTYGSPDQNTGLTLHVTPQIDYTSYGVISDTANWVTLSGSFVADSAYTNIIIGGFKNASEMNIVDFNSNSTNQVHASYYYIDNIVVEKLSVTNIPVAKTGIDCKVYPNPFDGNTTLTFNNTASGGHILKLFNAQGILMDQINGITAQSVKIERNNLPAGLYYYLLQGADCTEARGKLIIR